MNSISTLLNMEREEGKTYWLYRQRASHAGGTAQKVSLSLCGGGAGRPTWL